MCVTLLVDTITLPTRTAILARCIPCEYLPTHAAYRSITACSIILCPNHSTTLHWFSFRIEKPLRRRRHRFDVPERLAYLCVRRSGRAVHNKLHSARRRRCLRFASGPCEDDSAFDIFEHRADLADRDNSVFDTSECCLDELCERRLLVLGRAVLNKLVPLVNSDAKIGVIGWRISHCCSTVPAEG